MHTPYQVLVVSANNGNAMVHCGPPAKQQLLLLAHDAHYDVITELNAYFGLILVYNAGKATRPRKEVPTYPRNKEELPSVKQKLRADCQNAQLRGVELFKKHFNEMKCRLFPTTALHFVTDN